MNILDLLDLSFSNLWRTKVRTILTIVGVIVGIGALSSMVSFGTGMQKNITDTFAANDLFTSIRVFPKNANPYSLASGNIVLESEQNELTPLNDSTLNIIQNLNKIEIAFPEIMIPVKLKYKTFQANVNLQALSAAMGQFKPYSNLQYGRFFSSDSAYEAIIDTRTLKKMNLVLQESQGNISLSAEDSAKGCILVHPDSVLGTTYTIFSAAQGLSTMNPMGIGVSSLGQTKTKVKIVGILDNNSDFSPTNFSGGIIIPAKTSYSIPQLGFSSVWDLLSPNKQKNKYNSFYVRVKGINDVDKMSAEIKVLGFSTFSIADQLKEIKRNFLIMDGILGAIGTIALFVAALGIINTMLMSILERTREIGIMKSIGGAERDIRRIFMIEASFIGLIGGIFGLILGYGVTRLANIVINTQLAPLGEKNIDLFYFSWEIILGSMIFAVLVSSLAGIYPAYRAARIDPVKALRHD